MMRRSYSGGYSTISCSGAYDRSKSVLFTINGFHRSISGYFSRPSSRTWNCVSSRSGTQTFVCFFCKRRRKESLGKYIAFNSYLLHYGSCCKRLMVMA